MSDNFDYLNLLRQAELDLILERFGPSFSGKSLLEIGSGTGAQLARLKKVCEVARGIDLEGSIYAGSRLDDIVDYDGVNIPFDDASFDFVYSSNVLEHCQEPEALHKEMQRVLRPGGIGVHVMPNHLWRLWSHLTHYPALPRKILQYNNRQLAPSNNAARPQRTRLRLLANVLVDPRHGEFGNRFSEVFHFHPKTWRRRLTSYGWVIKDVRPSGIFYTGGAIFSQVFSFNFRRKLARFLGSACHTFVVSKASSQADN